MSNAKQLANLRPWKPGQSGNPKGRPKRLSVLEILGEDKRRALIQTLFDQAMSGDTTAAKALLDRIDPTLARQELTGRDGDPILVGRSELATLTTEELRTLDALAGAREERHHRSNGADAEAE